LHFEQNLCEPSLCEPSLCEPSLCEPSLCAYCHRRFVMSLLCVSQCWQIAHDLCRPDSHHYHHEHSSGCAKKPCGLPIRCGCLRHCVSMCCVLMKLCVMMCCDLIRRRAQQMCHVMSLRSVRSLNVRKLRSFLQQFFRQQNEHRLHVHQPNEPTRGVSLLRLLNWS
jgi:hypothetical protein